MEVGSLHDPVAAVRFLREAWEPQRATWSCVKERDRAGLAEKQILFDTLLDTLRTGVPPFAGDSAVRLCTFADAIMSRREPFTRPRFAADAGLHASIASSYAKKGRVLNALVRFLRCDAVIEIGTAYGMSSMFIVNELPPDGVLVTLESSHPQIDIAREMLDSEPRVTLIQGFSQERIDEVRALAPAAQLLFHDGAHSAAAYVEDFEGYLPCLGPGAVVLYDDIRWEDERVSEGSAQTYAGWQQVVAHPAVDSAYEIDGDYGLLQIKVDPEGQIRR